MMRFWGHSTSILLSAALLSGCGDTPPAKPQANAPADKQIDQESASESSLANSDGASMEPDTDSDSSDANADDATNSITAAPPFDLSEATERFLFITPGGPLVVDLVIAIDGAPYQSAIDGLIARLLATDDGQSLTWEHALRDVRMLALRGEALPMEPADDGNESNDEPDESIQDDAARMAEQIALWDSNEDGLVQFEEAKAFIAPQADMTADAMANIAAVTVDRAMTRTVLNRWWQALDADGSGRLSGEEAARIATTLRRYDPDDDEVIRPADVLPSGVNAAARDGSADLAMRLTDQTNWYTLMYELEERFFHEGALAPESFSVDPLLFQNLDGNANSRLTGRELEALLTIAPHLVINVNFGESEIRPRGIQMAIADVDVNQDEARDISTNRLLFDIAGAGFVIRSADAGNADRVMRDAARAITRLDANGDGYLDEEEAIDDALAGVAPFDVLDADGNGMLFAEELVTPITWRQAAQLTDISISLAAQQQSVFAALDANADGRLTAREIRSAEQRIMTFDANGDGQIARGELPTMFSVQIRRADGAANPAGSAADGDTGPAWFSAMDTNDDGDISRREFLGSDEQFETLDANDDGLIDAAEAAAADGF